MAFKIKDGLRIGTTDIFNTSAQIVGTGVAFAGSTSGATTLVATAVAGTTSLILPAASDTLVGKATTDTLTNKSIAAGTNTISGLTNSNLSGTAGITNANLANSSVTIGTTAIALGASSTTIAGLTSIDATVGSTSFFATPTSPALFAAGTAVTIGATTGTTTVRNSLVVTGDLTINGTTTTVNSTTVTVDDIVLELGAVTTPTDTTANGGGISLLGATNKTITWDSANNNWSSSENWNILTGKVFKINNVSVLSSTTLGSGVTGSSLTSVGTIGTGVWQGTLIGATYGGTGVNNGSNTITLGGNFSSAGAVTHAGAFSQTFTATGNTSVTLPTSGTLLTTSGSGSSLTFGTGSLSLAGNLTTTGTFTTSLTQSASVTLALPGANGTLATLAGTETLTNKTIGTTLTFATATPTTISTEAVVTATVASASVTDVDTWPIATYRAVKYLITIKQGTNYQVSEIIVIHDGITTYMTEYGVIETNGVLGAFTSDILSATIARLRVTMGSATSSTINIRRSLMVV